MTADTNAPSSTKGSASMTIEVNIKTKVGVAAETSSCRARATTSSATNGMAATNIRTGVIRSLCGWITAIPATVTSGTMQLERRLVSLLILLAVVGAPALALRLVCAGHSCDQPVRSTAAIPFCSLTPDLRGLMSNGFREGRSPDVLAVAARPVGGGTFFDEKLRPEWPSRTAVASTRVPIGFQAPWLTGGSAVPAGTGLDDVAPTIAAMMDGLERPHPEVRSGRPIEQATTTVGGIRLVLQIVWKGVGSEDLEQNTGAWPTVLGLLETFGTMEGTTGSLPTDPAAVLTTIGTGGLPSEHGITGALLRDDSGKLREAWSDDAPVSVIAGLGDDVDELTRQRSHIGMVADDPTDRGLIGQDWYVAGDRDDFVTATRPDEVIEAVKSLLRDGYGRDDTPDLLAVTLEEALPRMDKTTKALIQAAVDAVGEEGVATAFTTTGSTAAKDALPAARVRRQVERDLAQRVVAATAPGGLYLDQELIADEAIDDDVIVGALKSVKDRDGAGVFADVFPAIAVSFGRYC